jgi:hypothetical protein
MARSSSNLGMAHGIRDDCRYQAISLIDQASVLANFLCGMWSNLRMPTDVLCGRCRQRYDTDVQVPVCPHGLIADVERERKARAEGSTEITRRPDEPRGRGSSSE